MDRFKFLFAFVFYFSSSAFCSILPDRTIRESIIFDKNPSNVYLFAPDYLSAGFFFHLCDHAYMEDVTFKIRKIKEGDLIFVRQLLVRQFIKKIHPRIKKRYILMVHMSAGNYDGQILKQIIDDPTIIAILSVDASGFQHPKLIPLPLGICPNTPLSKYECQDRKIFAQPISQIKNEHLPKKYLSYLNITMRPACVRQQWLDFLRGQPFCYTVEERISRTDFLRDVSQSYFVFSPPGDTYDSARTWETLYLGGIPVVLSSTCNSLFDDLPVVIINDINEVTEEFLLKKLEEFSQKTFNYQKLSQKYWIDLVLSYKNKKR